MASIGSSLRRICSFSVAALLVGSAGVTTPALAAQSPGAQSSAAPASMAATAQVEQATPVTPAQITGDSTTLPRGDVDWKPCGEQWPGYDCATVTVPLDHDRPSRETTSVALARWRATDTENRIGSVFVNPGGPGGSGVEYVTGGFGEFLGGQLGGRFDVVGFDPRGVGASEPLRCFETEEELFGFQAGQPVFPYLKEQYRPFFEGYVALAPECLDGRERIAGHMSTADVARDLDLLRGAVGDRGLTYLGVSYGSYLGTTYANLFPDRVRALAIDGVLDPRLWSGGRQITSDRTATQEVVDEFLRLCDEARSDCAFWTPEGSEQRWEQLSAAIRRDPLLLPEGLIYTYDFLIADVVSMMYAPEFWGGEFGGAAMLDSFADAALTGEASAAAEAVQVRSVLLDRLTAATARTATARTGSTQADIAQSDAAQADAAAVDTDELDYPNWFDAYYGNHCADTQYPHRFRDWVAIDRYARAGSEFGPLWWWENAGCADWPVNRDRYAGPWTAHTSSPVLVVGNYFDGATDYDGAVATDRLLRNSRLLTYAGWGHTAYERSQCVAGHVNAYLIAGELPPRNTVCPANPNPFVSAPGVARMSQDAPRVGLAPPWTVRPELPTAQDLAEAR